MKNWIIGTAGHVDHGKTALVKCLTGTDTDRLAEEKKRGITIENGFAFLDLPGGIRAGIVDVPGHEKFIRTMAAGAWGMDFVMLVIAADEGIKPQTKEHLSILSFLGIKEGITVLTKCDLASEELCVQREKEIRNMARGTFLEGRDIVRVSSRTEEGISQLKKCLAAFCSKEREAGEGVPEEAYLPVDRVFHVKGTGLVAAGTLTGGSLRKGEKLCLYPGSVSVKIRGLQVYGASEKSACPGQRAALNLVGEGKEKVRRGMVLAPKGSLFSSRFLDVKIFLCRESKYGIKHGSTVHLHIGTEEVSAGVFFPDKKERRSGEWGYAQLRLEKEVAVRRGQRFIIRFYSPLETIGGGAVLDGAPRKHKGYREEQKVSFAVKDTGGAKERIALLYREEWGRHFTFREAACRCGLTFKEAENIILSLEKQGILEKDGKGGFLHKEESLKLLKKKPDFHTVYENPYCRRIEGDYQKAGYVLFTTALYKREHEGKKGFPAAFSQMIKSGRLIRLNDQYCIHREWYEKAYRALLSLGENGKTVGTGDFRDALPCSRKTAISILEYFDKKGITLRKEEGRIVVKGGERYEPGRKNSSDNPCPDIGMSGESRSFDPCSSFE